MRASSELTLTGIQTSIILLVLAVFLGGCTMERRHYRNGFYISQYRNKQGISATSDRPVEYYSAPVLSDSSENALEQLTVVDSVIPIAESATIEETNQIVSIPQSQTPGVSVADHALEDVVSFVQAETTDGTHSPVVGISTAIFLCVIIIVTIALVAEWFIIMFAAVGVGMLAELIATILITVKLTNPKTELTEEVKRNRKRAVTFALVAVLLLAAFVALASMIGIAGVFVALLSFVSMVLALRFALKAYPSGRKEQNVDSDKSASSKGSYRPYIFAIISGWLAAIATLAGVLLLPTAVPIGIPIVLLCAAFGLGLYTLIRARQRKKRDEKLPEVREEERLSSLLLSSVFFSIVSVVISSLLGLLGLLLLLFMGGL